MNTFNTLINTIKSKDPNNVSSINDDINYDDIKKLWEKYLKEGDSGKDIDNSFEGLIKIGSLSKNIGVLNIYSKKDRKELFGLFYSNKETKYLEINSKQIKKVLDYSDKIMVLSYIINLNKK